MKKWTLMVYISADDVLDNFAVESLKQLKRAAGDDIEVFAQFDPNVPGKSPSQYVFDASKKMDPSINSNRIRSRLGSDLDMADPTRLTNFIKKATARCPADYYGLVLWGHGPELLFDDDVPPNTPSSTRRYFTPETLRQALQDKDLFKGKQEKGRLDIIAIDACCMATVEVASALQGCANYLIASQDDLPDASFPYEQLLDKLRRLSQKGDVQRISKMVPKAYKEAFVDYIPTPANELRGITLSAVDLDAIGTITNPLTELSNSLLRASTDPTLSGKILEARRQSHAFEFGLFVDLFDFCEQLDRTGHGDYRLTGACKSMQAAIKKCVIENESTASGKSIPGCHGLSVYFPYGTNHPIEKAVLNIDGTKNGTNHPIKLRTERIAELEKDYGKLQIDGQSDWIQFIKLGWSVILAKEVPDELDTHYSALQCTKNLLPGAAKGITLSPQPKKLLLKTGRRKHGSGRTNGTQWPIHRGDEGPEKHPPN